MGVLARGPVGPLAAAWEGLAERPAFVRVRAPETGLVMVRGRAGGTGQRFNLGEMTVTRCAVRLEDGRIGHGYVAGRDRRHAELAALFDALMQDPARRPGLEAALIGPLERAAAAARDMASRKAAATRVEFFTMTPQRGE